MTSLRLTVLVEGKDNIADGLKLELKIRIFFHKSKIKELQNSNWFL